MMPLLPPSRAIRRRKRSSRRFVKKIKCCAPATMNQRVGSAPRRKSFKIVWLKPRCVQRLSKRRVFTTRLLPKSKNKNFPTQSTSSCQEQEQRLRRLLNLMTSLILSPTLKRSLKQHQALSGRVLKCLNPSLERGKTTVFVYHHKQHPPLQHHSNLIQAKSAFSLPMKPLPHTRRAHLDQSGSWMGGF